MDHRNLKIAYRKNIAIREAIDDASDTTSFNQAWEPLGARFENLKEFCGGLGSILPNTSRVEADFSLMTMELSDQRVNLSAFSLAGILHCKQLKELEVLNIQ